MRRPKNFNFELSPGEAWVILGVEYRINPRELIEPWAAHVVQTWGMCRGEMGIMHFPDAGGLNDQSAWLMDAFNVCSGTERDLLEEEKRRGEDQR